VADHVAVLDAHLGPGVFPIALANDNLGFERHLPDGVEIVRPGSDEAFQPRAQPAPILAEGTGAIESGPLEQVSQTALRADAACRVVTADLVDQDCPWRHDPVRLSQKILKLYHAERSGK